MRELLTSGSCQKLFSRFLEEESGATAIEYGMITAMIGAALVATFRALSGEIVDNYSEIESTISDRRNAPRD